LGLSLIQYFFRKPQVLAALLSKDDRIFLRWDRLTRRRHVSSLAGADAHGRIAIETWRGEPSQHRAAVDLPSYEAVFRTMSTHVELDQPLTGDAAADAKSIVRALREGRHFSVIDALATPAAFSFTAHQQGRRVRQGETLAPLRPVTFSARTNGPPGTVIMLVHDGHTAAQTSDANLTWSDDHPSGTYRAEVTLPNVPGRPAVPWIMSNPIYAFPAEAGATSSDAPRPQSPAVHMIFGRSDAGALGHEQSVTSQADLLSSTEAGERVLGFRYQLGGGPPAGQFAALAAPTHGLAAYGGVVFTARADRPMRVSVQVRAADGVDRRWGRSVYLDRTSRTATVHFNDMSNITGVGATDLQKANTLLFVVDTTNTSPGTSGTISFSEIALQRR
jgi:hypothetical protein